MRSTEVLAGLLPVELLKNKTLEERIIHLQEVVNILTAENNELYKILEQEKPCNEHHIGFTSNHERGEQ